MAGYKFDYETKVWGGERLRVNPIHFRASRLYFALKEIKNQKKKLLDIGCGAGDFVEAFSYYLPKLDLTAIDISKKAIETAKKRNIKAKFIVSGAERLPFKDNSFDIVTCLDVIEHVKDPKKVLVEISRVIKKGGMFHTLVAIEDNWISPEGFLIKLGWKAKRVYGGHPHCYSGVYISKIVKDAGFRIKKTRYGEHFTNQIIEILYFSYLSFRNKNVESTVEGYLAKSKKNFGITILNIIKNFISIISYIEARLFSNVSGGLGIYLTCIKK